MVQGSYGQVHLVGHASYEKKDHHRPCAVKVQKLVLNLDDFAQKVRINKTLSDAAAAKAPGSNRLCIALATFAGTVPWQDGIVSKCMVMLAATGTCRITRPAIGGSYAFISLFYYGHVRGHRLHSFLWHLASRFRAQEYGG